MQFSLRILREVGFLHAVLLIRIWGQERFLCLKSRLYSPKTLIGILFIFGVLKFHSDISMCSLPSFLPVAQYLVDSFNAETHIFLQSWEILNFCFCLFLPPFSYDLFENTIGHMSKFLHTCFDVFVLFYSVGVRGSTQLHLTEKNCFLFFSILIAYFSIHLFFFKD